MLVWEIHSNSNPSRLSQCDAQTHSSLYSSLPPSFIGVVQVRLVSGCVQGTTPNKGRIEFSPKSELILVLELKVKSLQTR